MATAATRSATVCKGEFVVVDGEGMGILINVAKGLGILLLLASVLLLYRFWKLSRDSQIRPRLGLTSEGYLQGCGPKPNCVSSHATGKAYFEPLSVAGEPADAMGVLKAVVVEMGATLVAEREGYLHAEFRSALFGFVDDLEILIRDQKVHLRSASRVGHSDLDVNRKRLEELVRRFTEGAG